EAMKWFKKAADLGEPEGWRCLAALFLHGDGVPSDPITAVRLYETALAAGDQQSAVELAWLYLNGASRSPERAIAILRKAAEGKNAAAMRLLGTLFYQGKDVFQDYAEAARWYRRAADLGDSRAMMSLP